MKKPNKYVDIVFLILLGISLCLTFYTHYVNGYILSVNNILAVILFVGGIGVKISKPEKGSYLVLILLILATLNIINFTIGVGALHIGYLDNGKDTVSYEYPGIDPLFLLVFLTYWIINRKTIRDIWERLYYGSKEEQITKLTHRINFYYEKFNSYKTEELVELYKNYNEYPREAQIALKEIHEERDLSIIEF